MKRDALSKDEAVRACAIDNVFDVYKDFLKNLEQTDPEFYRYLYAD